MGGSWAVIQKQLSTKPSPKIFERRIIDYLKKIFTLFYFYHIYIYKYIDFGVTTQSNRTC
jgi:hypothetical protein